MSYLEEKMKHSRLLQIVQLLESRNLITSKELAELLNVSTRTIRRDIDTLCILGYPINSKRGNRGGWYLLDNFKSSLKTATEFELQTLLIRPSNQVFMDLDKYSDKITLENKLDKILSLISRKYVYIDSNDWFASAENSKVIADIYERIKDSKLIVISYQKSDTKIEEYTLKPLGLVLKMNRWYLIGQKINFSLRIFKATRIIALKETRENFTYPEDFSLEEYWKDSQDHLKKTVSSFQMKIFVKNSFVTHIEKYFRIINIEEVDYSTNGLTLIFDTKETAVRMLSGFIDLMTDIEPEHIKKEIIHHINTVKNDNHIK